MLKIESKKVEKTVIYFAVANSEENELEMKVAIDQWMDPPKTEADALLLERLKKYNYNPLCFVAF